jgi:transcriptional regulator with XRE-family HTH domain
MSQGDLASACGIGKPRLWRYENGWVSPSLRVLTRIARGLGVSEAVLLGEDDEVEAFARRLAERGVSIGTVEDARALADLIAQHRVVRTWPR